MIVQFLCHLVGCVEVEDSFLLLYPLVEVDRHHCAVNCMYMYIVLKMVLDTLVVGPYNKIIMENGEIESLPTEPIPLLAPQTLENQYERLICYI